MMMERILLVGGAMLAVGIALAAVVVLVTTYGATFEMVEDSVSGWLGKL
jgi:hypothetical protein